MHQPPNQNQHPQINIMFKNRRLFFINRTLPHSARTLYSAPLPVSLQSPEHCEYHTPPHPRQCQTHKMSSVLYNKSDKKEWLLQETKDLGLLQKRKIGLLLLCKEKGQNFIIKETIYFKNRSDSVNRDQLLQKNGLVPENYCKSMNW